MNALVDTNVLVDCLQGLPEAAAELERYRALEVSAITVAELVVGASTPARLEALDTLLAGCLIVPVDESVAREAGRLRCERRVRLPDALVWASARVRGSLLVTRDLGFPREAPEVRHPYRRA